ncbi:MAG: hypothetical protein Kow0080_23400 [Candidatus Promineifilaceae bacterium]
MAALRIVLIGEHIYLRNSLEAIFKQAGLSFDAIFQQETTIDEIRDCHPSHILIESGVPWCDKLVLQLLQLNDITIIRFNLSDNNVHIMNHHKKCIKQARDLLDLLHENHPSRGQTGGTL